ncbi:MAG TPA: ASKHA domain-containing protein [Anaerolineae bacterium]|nr:ASKHA domain-containing protein [Anaerolineae bacterium]
MDSAQVDRKRVYDLIRNRITTLELAPGSPINEKHLAEELTEDLASVQGAIELLAHDGLVVVTPRQEHGTYVANVHRADLDQLSRVRLTLEALSARLAAEQATAPAAADQHKLDLEVLESLRQEQTGIADGDRKSLLDLDHRFHQAIAQAARNRYLADTLEHFFGLSQRLWYLALPHLDFLPAAVAEHQQIVEAIQDGDADRAAQLMYSHVEGFYNKVRELLAIKVTASYGTDVRSVEVDENSLLGAAIIATGLPLEQPCAGRGTCHKCKVIAEGALSPFDEKEIDALTGAEKASGYRLACRALAMGDVNVTLAPIVVYSNKMFRACDDYKGKDVPLGLAIDLGSTTVAAFVTTLDTGRVCLGAAALNQQTAFGADVISRMAAAQQGPETSKRLSMLALSSIVQAVDALKLPRRIKERIQKVTIVGNCVMHHLLLQYPVDTLAELPFQPHSLGAVRTTDGVHSGGTGFGDTFPAGAEVALPPLIGGFVGSDALACLAYYGFDRAPGPIAAIDLGTNGEVMVTDGARPGGTGRIVVASTAAGPAFEGVNISCGTRAVDGAIVSVKINDTDGNLELTTIGDHPPVGLTGSGLLDLICELRRVGVIERSGRFAKEHSVFGHRLDKDHRGVRRFLITEEGVDLRGAESLEDAAQVSLYLTQHDVRELQKAKGAIRAATEILMAQVGLEPGDLTRMILTGSFGSQLNVEAVVSLGMIPPVPLDVVEPLANGAGFGAALFLDDEEFARGEQIAAQAEQVELDLDAEFNRRYIEAMELPGSDPA